MAFIKTIDPAEATGLLARLYWPDSMGFDDTAIHDIVQVTAMFNYYNRLADGLGLEPEQS
jgi:alkylhydroperoxidase family enzyme